MKCNRGRPRWEGGCCIGTKLSSISPIATLCRKKDAKFWRNWKHMPKVKILLSRWVAAIDIEKVDYDWCKKNCKIIDTTSLTWLMIVESWYRFIQIRYLIMFKTIILVKFWSYLTYMWVLKCVIYFTWRFYNCGIFIMKYQIKKDDLM